MTRAELKTDLVKQAMQYCGSADEVTEEFFSSHIADLVTLGYVYEDEYTREELDDLVKSAMVTTLLLMVG